MSDAGQKIFAGLKQAVAGDFTRVTIEGQTWERRDSTERAKLHKALEEFIYDRDGLAAWLTDRRNQAHSDGDTWSKGWHDANEEALAFVREVAFKRSGEATDAVLNSD